MTTATVRVQRLFGVVQQRQLPTGVGVGAGELLAYTEVDWGCIPLHRAGPRGRLTLVGSLVVGAPAGQLACCCIFLLLELEGGERHSC